METERKMGNLDYNRDKKEDGEFRLRSKRRAGKGGRDGVGRCVCGSGGEQESEAQGKMGND